MPRTILFYENYKNINTKTFVKKTSFTIKLKPSKKHLDFLHNAKC